MQLRVRGPNGQATVSVEPDATVSQLQSLIADKTGVAPAQQEILSGFPPKPLALPSDPDTTSIATLELQPGDSLTVRVGTATATTTTAPPPTTTATAASPSSAPQPASNPTPAAAAAGPGFAPVGMSEDEQLARAIAASLGETYQPPQTQTTTATTSSQPAAAAPKPTTTNNTSGGPRIATLGGGSSGSTDASLYESVGDGTAIARRVVADDNSCLFSAVGYVMQGSRSAAQKLRSVVAEAVLADPFQWSEAVLGKEPGEYAQWITDSRRWGGAIELSILADKYHKEIAAFDIQTQRVDIYGQGSGYTQRVLLVYDGLHYDALAVAARTGAPENQDVVVLPCSGSKTEAVMVAAKKLVARFHANRQFTDTASFTLRCGTCGLGLKGEKEAVQHARTTGHANFTEY